MMYGGDQFPGWQGDLLAGGLSGGRVDRLVMEDGEIVLDETVVHGRGRIRDLEEGPDGFIYIAIDDRQGAPTPIVRLEPAR